MEGRREARGEETEEEKVEKEERVEKVDKEEMEERRDNILSCCSALHLSSETFKKCYQAR